MKKTEETCLNGDNCQQPGCPDHNPLLWDDKLPLMTQEESFESDLSEAMEGRD